MSKKTKREKRARAWKARVAPVRTEGPRELSWVEMRRRVGVLAKSRGEYAGLPTPVQEARLVVAKKTPHYERLNGFRLGASNEVEPIDEADLLKPVNSWRTRENVRVIVYHTKDGRAQYGMDGAGAGERVRSMIDCLGISLTMDMAAEERAMETLRGLIKPHMFNAYRMLGYFIESSPRSGLVYLFRRLATTVVFKCHDDPRQSRVLCALCLHPIAFYDQTPMGAMVPTDDVIAHLVMMRADEHMFWRKANQHESDAPGAML